MVLGERAGDGGIHGMGKNGKGGQRMIGIA